ncbi:MAG TPA: family 10 glycosylhydrolase [Chitinophagaceae bacterium]|nr:family 10 glycosylhydrolase [Chitinophagaceae bacterium]
MKSKYLFSLVTASVYFLCSCNISKKTTGSPAIADEPKVVKEFRAAWVATVANINWPTKPGLSTDEQKKEAINLLDFLQQHHFNAVILQVRPQCDALYKSDLEPWSYYLTGEQGKAPSPYYDPLEFWIEAAHERGIELHVWLNPYRAHHKDGKEISEYSIVKKHPELVVYLKEGYWWMDPAQQGTRDHSTAVVMDLVKRYNIDGVHFDDYFYPYPSYNGGADFPDSVSWNAYRQSGGKLSRGDWRRNAVNVFIENLYKKIKSEKPYVKFGLSPFGIWRPGYPESIEGFDQYDQLYADAKLWLNKGWIDYFTPQLYWQINRMPQSFPVLLGWWAGENLKNRHLWPGISVGRDTSAKNTNEILSQIMISRGMLPESKGIVHWSISSLTRNPNMAKAILEGPYKKDALVPASSWLDKNVPAAPMVNTVTNEPELLNINWTHIDEKDVFRWVVYHRYNNTWSYNILPGNKKSLSVKKTIGENAQKQVLTAIAVTAIDRTGNESEKHIINVEK